MVANFILIISCIKFLVGCRPLRTKLFITTLVIVASIVTSLRHITKLSGGCILASHLVLVLITGHVWWIELTHFILFQLIFLNLINE
jgi:hypothetical protein